MLERLLIITGTFSMMQIIGHTTIRCQHCQTAHPGILEQDAGVVYGRMECPRGARRVRLSDDAEMYRALRARSRCLNLPERSRRTPLIALLPITDHCNFRCPVCYASSQPQTNPHHLPLAEIEQRVRHARRDGVKTISLTGGEPTLHPQLPEVIRCVRALGLRVYLITNGLRLGTEPGLALELRRAGLAKVKLQLDSFQPAIHERLRGNRHIPEKIAATNNILAAGLRLGTITTVSKPNLPELGDILRFSLSLAPGLNTVVFQAAVPAGRFELCRDQLVDKEAILRQVLDCDVLTGATLDDVWPLPRVEPWGMRVHPDCGVNLLLMWSRGELKPARELVDLPALHQRLHGLGERTDWWARNVAPLRHILASARHGQRTRLLRCLAGFLFGNRQHGMVVIGVGAFCCREFFDEQRIAGCATVELTPHGAVSPCEWYGQAQA